MVISATERVRVVGRGASCTWIVAHASGSDQDGIVLLPGLDVVLASKHGPHTGAA